MVADFFFRFFLPSPLPMNNNVDCSSIECCRVVIVKVVGGANESNTEGNSANKNAMRANLIEVICILLVLSRFFAARYPFENSISIVLDFSPIRNK